MDGVVYRDYSDFIIAYSSRLRNYIIIEDVYADFFRLKFIENLTDRKTEQIVSEMYGVGIDIVSSDFAAFKDDIYACLLNKSKVVVAEQLKDKSMQRYIFDRMTELMIPFSATIEVTDTCNLKCIHCYRGAENVSYWNEEHFIEVLRELKSLGTMNLTLTGGEPFTNPDFCKFLEISNSLGFVVSIQSNLLLINDDIINALRRSNVSDVSVSLYSTIEKEHDYITNCPGSMKRTMNNINLLVQNGIHVSLNSPIMRYNKNAMTGIKKYANSLGIDVNFALKIIPSQVKNKKVENYNIFNAEFIRAAINNKDINLYKSELELIRVTKPRKRYCQTGFRSITFDAQGNMLICNAYRKQCGSLTNSDVKSLWYHSEYINKWRNETSLVRKKCYECQAYSYCEPCPAHFFTQTGYESDIDDITCMFGNAFYAADIDYRTNGGEYDEERI
ncbi:MAG: radical SAM protein [Phascolarctobacterium sp.]